MRSRRFRSLAVAASATALALAGPSSAAEAGRLLRWKHNVVTYRDQSSYGAAVAQAVRWINDLPANVTLVRARRGARANVRVVSRSRPGTNWAGLAWSWRLGNSLTSGLVTLNSAYLDLDYITSTDRANTAAHELLHALGVPHLHGCALMHPDNALDTPSCNTGLTRGTRRCGPQVPDLRALVARYRGSVGGFAGYRCADTNAPGDDGDVPSEPVPPPGPATAEPGPAVPAPVDPPVPVPPAPRVLLFDSFESGTLEAQWEPGPTTGAWQRTDETAGEGAWSVTDSPGGLYDNGTDSWLVLREPVDLRGRAGCLLTFRARIQLESGYDFLSVEALDPSGGRWTEVASYTGTGDLGFITRTISLAAVEDRLFRFRFRLQTDSSIVDDGVHLDAVSVECRV